MLFRMLGLVVSMCLIGYMLMAVLGSDNKISQSIDKNPAVVEQKAALQSAGVPTDPKQLKSYVDQQAKDLDAYQHSADGLMKNQ